MSRILAYTSPARGHLYPLVPILLELRDRGHEISVRTLAAEVPALRALGLPARAIAPEVEARALDDWRGRGTQQRLVRSVQTFAARAPHDARDLRAAIEAEQPDLVVVDINAWGALAAAEQWGGSWAAFCPYPLTLSSRDVPPFGPGLPPARGAFGRARDRALRPLVMGTMERAFLPPLNQMRGELGLAELASTDDLLLRPPLLLYFSAEPFEYPRSDWPDSVVMVGASAWEPSADTPEWLDQIDEPIVLVTTSSEYQDDGRLVDVALEALADLPVHVVATVPAARAPAGRAVPANAHVVPFVPHAKVLPRAVCAITHGGMGATQKALAHAVPVCAVPFGRDQLEVARRVEVARAGVRLPAGRLTRDRLRSAVRSAMTMTAGAEQVAAGFTSTGGPAAAADALEGRLLSLR
jgi:MGT family glycosyltransferase